MASKKGSTGGKKVSFSQNTCHGKKDRRYSSIGNNSALPSNKALERLEKSLKGERYQGRKDKSKPDLQWWQEEYIKEKQTAPKRLELVRVKNKKFKHISDVQKQKFNDVKADKAGKANGDNRDRDAPKKYRYTNDKAKSKKNRFIVVNGKTLLNADKYGKPGSIEQIQTISKAVQTAENPEPEYEAAQKGFYKYQQKIMFFNRAGKTVREYGGTINAASDTPKITAQYDALEDIALSGASTDKTAEALTDDVTSVKRMFKVFNNKPSVILSDLSGTAEKGQAVKAFTKGSHANRKMFRALYKSADGAGKLTGYAVMTAKAQERNDNIGVSAGNAMTASPKAIAKDTALSFTKGAIGGLFRLNKSNKAIKQRAVKKYFFLKRNTSGGRLIANTAHKVAAVASKAVKEMILLSAKAAASAGMAGAAAGAVVLTVFIVFFIMSSQSKAAFPFDYKVVLNDLGGIEYEELDPVERITEFKAVMDGEVGKTNNRIAELFNDARVSAVNDYLDSGIDPISLSLYETQMRDYGVYGGYYDNWGNFNESMPEFPEPSLQLYDENGMRTSAVYAGARWYGTRDWDEGATEAESVPYGQHYDEMLCTLAAYYIKLVSNPAPGEEADGDFHVMNEDDVELFYNSLPFWIFEVWQETLVCGGCMEYSYTVSSTDEEGNSYSETVTVIYCPGHIWDVCNLILHFEQKLRDMPVFNEDGTPKLDGEGNQITESVMFGGMESVWDKLQFDETDGENYGYIRDEYDRV